MDWGAGGLQGKGEFQDEVEKVSEVEITYIDPADGSVCRKQVFCEIEDWKERYQARLLVSSDLVNSLSEAVGIWLGRFKLIHQRLEHSRMYYFYELGRLRKHMQIVADGEHAQRTCSTKSLGDMRETSRESLGDVRVKDVAKKAKDEKEEEVCPVHFFFPEAYLDRYTSEMLEKAVKSFRDALEIEIASILEKIHVVGAGTWWQLLAYFLKNGQDPMELVIGLLHHIEEPSYRREIVNTMTNGLQDLYDALLLQFESLQDENQDMVNRSMEIAALEGRQNQAMLELHNRMEQAEKDLEFGFVFEEPPEEDISEAVAEAQAAIFETKEASLKEYMAEVRRLRALMEEWQARAAEQCDEEAINALQAVIKDWKRRTKVVQMRGEKIDGMTEEVEERVSKIEDKIAKQKDLMNGLREKLSGIPGINPATLKLQQLKREIKRLEMEARKIKAAMMEPNNRIKAMRAQLKALYKKLGWDWDLSDSEDEDGGEEQPYWKRRKTAANGFLPFNQTDFLFGEKDFHHRRSKQLSGKLQIEQKTQILAQMKAKRHDVGGGSGEIQSRELLLDEEEPGPTLFGTEEPSRDPIDPVERAISMARQRLGYHLPGPREALLETPCWRRARHMEERECKQYDLDRLLQLRESFESQIQHCVECFVELLPASGSLGDLRSQLTETLAKLRHLPEENEQAQYLERELQDTCTVLQGMIDEAISYGDQVHPISAAMIHSVRFSDLRNVLGEVLESEHQLRQVLKAQRNSRGFWQQESVGSQPSPSDTGRHASNSSEGSPRIRGQSAPGGSSDDRGLPLSVASRALPTAEELSESLKLPPRLLAQTMPLLGARQPKKEARKKVDFGFRPDGAGEDSLENWSLFKVSKASTATSGFGGGFGDSVSTGLGMTRSSGFTDFIGDHMRKTENKVRRQRGAIDCDFHEYMSQSRQMNEAWQTASTPSLSDKVKKKCCPPLPKLLVKSRSATRSVTADGNATRGDVFGTWEKSPARLSASVPSKKLAAAKQFGATAPPNSGFTKW